jgi:alpha-beta hydrolase superfamily lysophospholipase
MSARPVWFGRPERPLYGWLHTAPAAAVAPTAAVLCPSLGIEGLAAHRTYRRLAGALAGAGIDALRVDYDGTGDSAGAQGDPGRVHAWSASIGEAVSACRAGGANAVIVIGMRAGALLAVAALQEVRTEGLVLWDPVADGRSFLREQRALRMISVEAPVVDDGSVEGPGVVFDPATAEDLGHLRLAASIGALPPRVLLLTRPDRPEPPGVRAVAEVPGMTVAAAEGQADLLDVLPDAAAVPEATLDRIVQWCAGVGAQIPTPRSDSGSAPRPGGDPWRSEALVTGAGDSAVLERAVMLGAAGLFAIVAEPADGAANGTVLLSNAGVLPHVGPARVWVELARRLAGAGLRVARMDQSGIGDSAARPGRPEGVVYTPDALDDFEEAVRALMPDSPADVVLAGLCSGAYHSIETGQRLGSRHVCAVNPILTFSPAEATDGGQLDPRRAAVQPLRGPFRMLARRRRAVAVGERLPGAAWWLLDRLGLQPSPGRGLERLVEGGTELLLVCGEEDSKPFRRRASSTLRRLERSGRFHFEVVNGLDHTMLARGGREAAVELLAQHLLRRLASPTRPSPPPVRHGHAREP